MKNEMIVKLPEGMSADDFVDFLNGDHSKQLKFIELPEVWTSAED